MRLPSPHSGGAPLREQRGQARPQAALLLCSPAGLVAWQGAGVDVLQVEVGLGGGVGGVRVDGPLTSEPHERAEERLMVGAPPGSPLRSCAS